MQGQFESETLLKSESLDLNILQHSDTTNLLKSIWTYLVLSWFRYLVKNWLYNIRFGVGSQVWSRFETRRAKKIDLISSAAKIYLTCKEHQEGENLPHEIFFHLWFHRSPKFSKFDTSIHKLDLMVNTICLFIRKETCVCQASCIENHVLFLYIFIPFL